MPTCSRGSCKDKGDQDASCFDIKKGGELYTRCKLHNDPAKEKKRSNKNSAKNSTKNNAKTSAKKRAANVALGEAAGNERQDLFLNSQQLKNHVALFSSIIDPLILANEHVSIHVYNVGGSVQHQHNEAFGSFSSRGKGESVLLLNDHNPKETDFIRIFGETNVVVYKTADGELPYTTNNASNCDHVEKAVQNVS
jgi:hypothetical protein